MRLFSLAIGSALAWVLAIAAPAAAADPAVEGSWGPVIPWPLVTIHAALTPTGQVLTWQGDFGDGGEQYLFDPSDSSSTHVPKAAADMFCAGQAVTSDGRILVLGGTSTSGGIGTRNTTAFDFRTDSWRDLALMNHPRWYATGTTLADGRVLTTSGYDQYGGDLVTTPEVYDPHADVWTDLPGATQAQPVYPFQYQLPDGRLLWAGASEVPSVTKVLDLDTQTWSDVDTRVIDGASIANYAPGKFLKAGSAADEGDDGVSSSTAFTLDMNDASPQWQPTSDMALPRSFVNLTNLPDGTVLATGGDQQKSSHDDTTAALPAELWDPSAGTWRTLASMTVPRLYHSTAVLLPDGRVFVSGSGGDPGITYQYNVQVFSPPYLFKGERPTITSAPTTVSYGETTTIATPQAGSIASVSLIRTGSVTHSFDQNARAMSLSFTRKDGAIDVTMPPDGRTAPPGYYMLFIVNGNGVPSVASMVHFPAAGDPPDPPAPSPSTPSPPAGSSSTAGTSPTPTTTTPTKRAVRASVRFVRWKRRRLYLRVRCPHSASSTCRLKLAVLTSDRRGRTVGRRTVRVRRGHATVVSLRVRSKLPRRKLRLRVTTATSAGILSATKRLP